MKYAMWIEIKLINLGFRVEQYDIPGGESFHLDVGAIISIYDNGTVMVQGKLQPKYKAWALKVLRQILPKNTRWHDK